MLRLVVDDWDTEIKQTVPILKWFSLSGEKRVEIQRIGEEYVGDDLNDMTQVT